MVVGVEWKQREAVYPKAGRETKGAMARGANRAESASRETEAIVEKCSI